MESARSVIGSPPLFAAPALAPARGAAPLTPSQFAGLGLVLALACILPFFSADYRVFQYTMVLVYAIALFGLNLLTGYNGQISLGHGAFYAFGGYLTAILMVHLGWPYWIALPSAGALCFGAVFAFGLPALRLGGHFLALATFAL